MPGLIGDSSSSSNTSSKRKRPASDQKPAKRARSESSEEDVQAQILLLENEIFESKKNYNNIGKLIKLFQHEDEDVDNSMLAAISLCRVFARLMSSGDMAKKSGSTEKDIVVIQWLRKRYSEYKSSLLLLFREEGVESTALTLCMRLLKAEGQYLRNGHDYHFPASFLTEIIQALLGLDGGEAVRKEFSAKYVEEYDDVRFYTFKSIRLVLRLVFPHRLLTLG
jgi:U3 small nucleolar RNA-associated protein 19